MGKQNLEHKSEPATVKLRIQTTLAHSIHERYGIVNARRVLLKEPRLMLQEVIDTSVNGFLLLETEMLDRREKASRAG